MHTDYMAIGSLPKCHLCLSYIKAITVALQEIDDPLGLAVHKVFKCKFHFIWKNGMLGNIHVLAIVAIPTSICSWPLAWISRPACLMDLVLLKVNAGRSGKSGPAVGANARTCQYF